VALSNLAHLSNADFRGPRVDWRDLEQHCRGELICLTGAPMVGVLSPLVEHAADPSNPTEAMPLTRRLAELFPHLYIELAYHHHPREKLINRGLVALAQRLDLPLVATNAVRFARKQDALTSSVLAAAPDRYAGVASGVNNAVARSGSLLAVAALPALVGLSGSDYRNPTELTSSYQRALLVCAVLLIAGGVVSFVGLTSRVPTVDEAEMVH
jgi:hypothetical protein